MRALSKRTSVLIATVIIIVTIIAVIFSLWASRPVVEYSMSGYAYLPHTFSFNPYVPFYTSTMPGTYTVVNSNTPLMVALHWENKANVDASLQLTLTAQNANITWFSNYSTLDATDPGFSTPTTGQNYSGTTITFNTEIKANSTIQNKYLNIFPVGNPQTFTITYSVTDASNTFTLIPVREITATYELTNQNIYHLIK